MVKGFNSSDDLGDTCLNWQSGSPLAGQYSATTSSEGGNFDHAPFAGNLFRQQIGIRFVKVRRAAKYRHLEPMFFQRRFGFSQEGFVVLNKAGIKLSEKLPISASFCSVCFWND
jgi:hypothetical protein